MLIPSKFHYPEHSKKNVLRLAVVARLNQSRHYPLTLIQAPAGYGKTTAVSQWAVQQPHLCWLSLDKQDDNPDTFFQYFYTAITRASGQTDLPLSHAKYDFFQRMNEFLIHVSTVETAFTVVLDNFHYITHPEIQQALKYWLAHQPETMSLILLTRQEPALGIASLRVKERVLEVGVNALAFTKNESLEFIHQRLSQDISDKTIAAFHQFVSGWPTALCLARISLTAAQTKELVLNSSYLNDYLLDEVWGDLSESEQHFLLHCGLLRQLDESVLSTLLADAGIHQKLSQCEKKGVFLQQSDLGKWQFHTQFHAFLREQSAVKLGDDFEALHQQLAEIWLQRYVLTEATYHALQLKNNETLLKILEIHGWTLFHQGELTLLEQGLRKLNEAVLKENIELVLLQAWVIQSQHRHTEVMPILNNISTAVSAKTLSLSVEQQAELDVLRAQVVMNDGDDKLAFTLADNALKNLSPKSYYAQIVAMSLLAESQHCQGQLADALVHFQQTEKMARQYHTYQHILWPLLQQSEILLAQGFLQAAFDNLEKAEIFVHENHLEKVPMYEFVLRLKGKIAWEWYELEKVEQVANAGMAVLTKVEDRLQCLALLCKNSLVRGDLDNAQRQLKDIVALQSMHNYHPDWLGAANEAQLLMWQMRDSKELAQNWVIQENPPSSDKNHFSQLQWRNLARAYLLINDFEKAKSILDRLIDTARAISLTSDLNRALILRNRLYFLQNEKVLAQKDLLEALKLTRQTNFISAFVVEGEVMAQQIRHLLQLNVLDEIVLHKAQFILKHINQFYRHKFAHFDEEFVAKLLSDTKVPELLKISPLTQREWQVLGLIYSGYSNDQIAEELQVAATTIKTHIRNLYQKIGVPTRQEAINYTRELLNLMGYH
ncbi:HTH-type transcriptional regulator MalT [uncultured Actinobacillus sp.]|uniref:HTH-type transcriptional regulator MalT n=1 Tax=uncultured Actinobacillus sp. TaxID=417616 RepID=UPI0025E53A05|nr:HTH-type transcriptional regulator MalT [uncultured Actinobacillus sp.]